MGNPYAPPGEPRPPGADPRPGGPHADGPHGGAPQGWPSPGAGPGDVPPHAGPHPGRQPGPPRPGPPPHDDPRHPGPHGGPPRPARPAPDSPVVRATSRRVLHFLAFLLASVVTSGLPLPWQVASLAFVGAAIVVGLRALVLAWRGGIRGGLVVMLAVGVTMAGFVGLAMLSLLALWPQQMERQECLARALTISSTRACELSFERAVEERLGGLGTSGRS